MNVYTCTTFEGHYPVGSAALVVAENKARAVKLLNEVLRGMGLPGDAKFEDVLQVDMQREQVDVLCDGNY